MSEPTLLAELLGLVVLYGGLVLAALVWEALR